MTHGRRLRVVLGLALGALASTASAADLDFDLSNSAARAEYRFAITDSGLNADVGFLHHKDDGDMLHVGIELVGDAGQGSEPLKAGLGVRAVRIESNSGPINPDGSAVAVGGFFRYVLPEYNRFAFGGYAYYAPSVTSFGDMERYLEIGVRADYRVLDKASLYVGLRDVSADFTTGDVTIDDGLHVGISLEF